MTRLGNMAGRLLLTALLLCIVVAGASGQALSGPDPARNGRRAPPPSAAAPGDVRVGVFLYSVQELDLARHSFRVSFNVWWRFHGDTFDPIATLQIVNARSTTVVLDDKRRLPEGDTYVDARVDAVIERVLDTSAFPFDRHRLRIEIESPYEDDSLRYVVDTQSSMIDPEMYSPGWRISDFSIHEERKHYPTDFGLKERTSDRYSRAVVEVTARRIGWRLAIDYFVGFITCVLICLSGFLVHPRLLPARATMIGTAVFAAVGNKYIVNALTDTAARAQITNIVVVTSFSMVIILLLSAIACERMIEAGHTERALRVNKRIGIAAVIGCLLVTLYITRIALA